jgi:hypothetical protein
MKSSLSITDKRLALFHFVQGMAAFCGAPLRVIDAADNLSDEQVAGMIKLFETLRKSVATVGVEVSKERAWPEGIKACDSIAQMLLQQQRKIETQVGIR